VAKKETFFLSEFGCWHWHCICCGWSVDCSKVATFKVPFYTLSGYTQQPKQACHSCFYCSMSLAHCAESSLIPNPGGLICNIGLVPVEKPSGETICEGTSSAPTTPVDIPAAAPAPTTSDAPVEGAFPFLFLALPFCSGCSLCSPAFFVVAALLLEELTCVLHCLKR
jgi:hypothetical protein